jgi:hypothetical protein
MNFKAENKINILSNTLSGFFGDKMNLARIKFLGLFISALCKVQTVCFEKQYAWSLKNKFYKYQIFS